eukprot:5927255-Pleurochrysis_carterae.AAC.1
MSAMSLAQPTQWPSGSLGVVAHALRVRGALASLASSVPNHPPSASLRAIVADLYRSAPTSAALTPPVPSCVVRTLDACVHSIKTRPVTGP